MKNSPFPASIAIAILILTFASESLANSDKNNSLAASDAAAIRSVLERYRTGWLAGDAGAVRSAFTEDAVLLPHHGVPPVIGMAAINEFWFPTSSTKTTITKFVQMIDEVGGGGILAYVRGRSELEWRIEDGAAKQNWRNAGNFLAIFKKQTDGKWLMSHLIWNDPPNQQVN
jgi:uncharacterized protein (TIGR02246 family)